MAAHAVGGSLRTTAKPIQIANKPPQNSTKSLIPLHPQRNFLKFGANPTENGKLLSQWNGKAGARIGGLRCNAASGGDGGGPVDKSGAGKSWVSPDWLTSALSLGKGPDVSGIPVADAKLEDVKDLLGGALFLPLFKWMMESGPVYRLAAGPRNFVIVGDPAVAKHVLKGYGKYAKGLVAEVAEFLFGSGFAIAEGQLWTVFSSILCISLHCPTYINFEFLRNCIRTWS